jgi:hypothetical protein
VHAPTKPTAAAVDIAAAKKALGEVKQKTRGAGSPFELGPSCDLRLNLYAE